MGKLYPLRKAVQGNCDQLFPASPEFTGTATQSIGMNVSTGMFQAFVVCTLFLHFSEGVSHKPLSVGELLCDI
jgi:hypothetical protein